MTESRLNTKTKRIGALVMWSGMAVVVFAALQFDRLEYAINSFSRNPVERFFQIGGYHNGLARFTIWIGAIMVVLGLLWSYLFDSTIGKVVRWIETGSPTDNQTPQAIAVPKVETRPTPNKPIAPPKPPSRWKKIATLAAQSWLTIAASIVAGFIFVTEGKLEALVWPGFIAGVFTVQWLMRLSSDPSGCAFSIIVGSKFIFAYLAFAFGAIVALLRQNSLSAVHRLSGSMRISESGPTVRSLPAQA